jgi:hypothetical integral membrane protein (TIGR02206 family)
VTVHPPLATFSLFGPSHWCALGAVAAACIAAWHLGRLPGVRRHAAAVALGIVGFIAVDVALGYWILYREGRLDLERAIPLHLCDFSLLCAALALPTRRQVLFEFGYFYGIGGAVLAMLTPDLQHGFPHPFFFKFFLTHGVIVFATVYLMSAFDMKPLPGAVLRMVIAGNTYIGFAGTVNWLVGTNYGYLAAKPAGPTLMDHLGPWPWYILAVEAAGLALVLLLYGPWWAAARGGGAAKENGQSGGSAKDGGNGKHNPPLSHHSHDSDSSH